jgi:hypothetical protein
MTERHLDQWLGEQAGEAARDDVLEALRGHILGDVIVQLELPDGGSEYERATRGHQRITTQGDWTNVLEEESDL